MEIESLRPKESAFCLVTKRLIALAALSIAFGYIEASVVVYLRAIFFPEGFVFPLAEFGIETSPLWMTEIGREASTLVLIISGAYLFGRNVRERVAGFMIIFGIWDIFFYVWLKVLVNWPASIMDWDILFLIPVIWAGPVLAPVLISVVMIVFGLIVIRQSCYGQSVKIFPIDWLGFSGAGVLTVVVFCLASRGIMEPGYESYFNWPLFLISPVAAVALFIKCLLRSSKSSE
jgi:hypothetical protein